MTINALKEHLCALIESAYQTALAEGHHEIIHPFRIVIREDGEIEYAPLGQRTARGRPPKERPAETSEASSLVG